ncbi:MAG: chitobiase/beta-hexosaminidase C-terminal domain-containing protein [Deltaproteobacteria bacterium]|nr:MAG: chitobiase/beta-hexosaminidase C-terminal domain-containing protein [Deltaproteobacteria bacterium]
MTKFFFFLLFYFFLLFAFRGEARAGELYYGDAQASVTVTIDTNDILRIRQNAGGYPNVPLLGNADATGHDCRLAVSDALGIRQYMLGFRPDLPVFTPDPTCWAIELSMTGGDRQEGFPNQTLPQPLGVNLNNLPACTQTISGCTLGGVAITYEITGDTTGGATLPGSVTTIDIDTDSSGNASALLTMGSGPGTVTVVASVDLYSADGVPLTTASVAFTAVAIGCSIMSVGPDTGCPGDAVSITGTTFGALTGSVRFDGVTAAINSWSNTLIIVEAPGGDFSVVTVMPTVVGSCSLAGVYSYDNLVPNGLAASPSGGSYCVTTVSLSASDGTIYYTLDGSGPTTLSPVYTIPIDITVDTTLKFMAVDSCGNQSGIVTEIYDIDNEVPTGLAASPSGGSYCATTVSLSVSDGTIYYTLDGSGPTTLSPVYMVPIDISTDTTLRFMAVDSCGNQSGTVTEVYIIDNASPGRLEASTTGGEYCPPGLSVTLSCDDPGAAIHYTTDGSGPTTLSPVYTVPIDISTDTTLRFMAVDSCGNQSGTVTEVYDIDAEAAVSITSPIDGFTLFAGDVWVSGTADTDITAVMVTSDQGHSESSGIDTGGNWSVVLTGVTLPSISIDVSGTDDCGNIGGDSVAVPIAQPSIWYVDINATGDRSGTSWGNAFIDVQSAADTASSGDWIWVAQGTYNNIPASTNPILAMKAGVEVYGGFTGTESDLSERGAPADYPTVLDGENMSWHVVVAASDVRLDGFIIANGNANGGSWDSYGAGTYNRDNSAVIIANCTFSGNSSVVDGGGICNYQSSLVKVTDCIFNGNSARIGGGVVNYFITDILVANCTFSGNSASMGGGGMENRYSSPDIIDCTFSGNSSDSSGGGLYNYDQPSPSVINCTFDGNTADGYGGGIYNQNSSPLITNCTFSGNSAGTGYSGGGIFNYYSSSPTITDCTFVRNSAQYGAGGIYNYYNSSPTITNCTFIGNSSAWYGGGIYNYDFASPVITNCTFIGNSAYYGGGICNLFDTSPVITNCEFRGNSASYGGGIDNQGSSPEIINCTFSENSATNEGGGMHNDTSLPIITNCIMWNDSPDEIYDVSSTPTVTYSDIEGGILPGVGNISVDPLFVGYPNLHLQSGSLCKDMGTANGAPGYDLDGNPRPWGGGYDMGAYEYGYPLVADWYVDTDATGAGTGISWADAFTTVPEAAGAASIGDTIWVAEGIYTSDSPTTSVLIMKEAFLVYGGFTGTEGDLFERGDPTAHPTVLDGEDVSYHVVVGASNALLDGFILTGGNASGFNPDNRGGGMINNGVINLLVTNCTFSGNSAGSSGGGVYNYNNSSLSITSCTFAGNSAAAGGGMYNWDNSSPTITNCTFSGNTASNIGGGMYNWDNSSPVISNCTFRGNSAVNSSGGGMYNNQYSSPILTDCIFSDNTAQDDGGGILNTWYSSSTITSCTFISNSAQDFNGGGIANYQDSLPTITNCKFSGNSAEEGGGVYSNDSSPDIIGCTFNGNSAVRGGGVNNTNNSSSTITNCIFIGNFSTAWGGAGLANLSSSPEINNCTFSGNSAVTNGGGIYNLNSFATITNCILWGDSPDEIYDDSSSPTVTYSDIERGYPGTGNIEDDPLFVTGPDGDYYLSQRAAGQGVDSPCVDTGSDMAAALGMDDKTTRTDSETDTGIVDMGYHYQP